MKEDSFKLAHFHKVIEHDSRNLKIIYAFRIDFSNFAFHFLISTEVHIIYLKYKYIIINNDK